MAVCSLQVNVLVQHVRCGVSLLAKSAKRKTWPLASLCHRGHKGVLLPQATMFHSSSFLKKWVEKRQVLLICKADGLKMASVDLYTYLGCLMKPLYLIHAYSGIYQIWKTFFMLKTVSSVSTVWESDVTVLLYYVYPSKVGCIQENKYYYGMHDIGLPLLNALKVHKQCILFPRLFKEKSPQTNAAI